MTVPLPITIAIAAVMLLLLAIAVLDIFQLRVERVRYLPFALLPVIWIAADAVLFGWGMWYWSVSKTPELSDPAHRTGRLQLKRESRVR